MTLSRLATAALALAVPLLACASAVNAAALRHGPPAQVLIATYVQPLPTGVAYHHHHRSKHHRQHHAHHG